MSTECLPAFCRDNPCDWRHCLDLCPRSYPYHNFLSGLYITSLCVVSLSALILGASIVQRVAVCLTKRSHTYIALNSVNEVSVGSPTPPQINWRRASCEGFVFLVMLASVAMAMLITFGKEISYPDRCCEYDCRLLH